MIRCHRCGDEAALISADEEPRRYRCETCKATTSIGFTTHAENQWVTRGESRCPPDNIWDRARTLVTDPRDWSTQSSGDVDNKEIVGHRFVCDEARYDEPTQTVLLRRDSSIVTVIDATSARNNCRYSIIQTLIADGADADRIATVYAGIGLKKRHFPIIKEREKNRQETRAIQGEASASDAVASGRKPHSVDSPY